MECWKLLADWMVAIGTLVLAFVAVFQDKIRNWLSKPEFAVTSSTERPHCVMVPVSPNHGNRIYMRVWVSNVGNVAAKNVEVYARELRRFRVEGKWEVVKDFPPMNLRWADVGSMYWPSIPPGMGKHCDVVHIHDPALRDQVGEESEHLNLDANQTSMAFDLITAPNHKGHIVGPGVYELDILVAAENAKPHPATVTITLDGSWVSNEATMFRDHMSIKIWKAPSSPAANR